MSDIQLVQIDQARRQDFIKAWESAFSRRLDSSVYDWIFDGINVIYAALVDGEIAAGYCLYPLKGVLEAKPAVALLCNNVFVHPAHQGKHLFTKLGKLALQDAGHKGYGDIAFGIPNRQALPGHKRVGWGVQPTIKFLEKSRGTPAKSDVLWARRELSETERGQIQLCSEEASKGRHFSIIKTADFVRWRYESKPGTSYWFGLEYDNSKLMAYCVCKFYEPTKTLHVLDIDGVSAESVRNLIDQLSNIPEEFEKINVWSSTAYSALFVGAGFDETELEDNLIFITPGDLQAVHFDRGVNVCLADNDVY
jgi:GNAT superfamily N-acetyltransferase